MKPPTSVGGFIREKGFYLASFSGI
jgi:hypothetical protein